MPKELRIRRKVIGAVENMLLSFVNTVRDHDEGGDEEEVSWWLLHVDCVEK